VGITGLGPNQWDTVIRFKKSLPARITPPEQNEPLAKMASANRKVNEYGDTVLAVSGKDKDVLVNQRLPCSSQDTRLATQSTH
jgi:hypothetical protein